MIEVNTGIFRQRLCGDDDDIDDSNNDEGDDDNDDDDDDDGLGYDAVVVAVVVMGRADWPTARLLS